MKKKLSISILSGVMALSLLGGFVGIGSIAEGTSLKTTSDGFFTANGDIQVENGVRDSRDTLGTVVTLSGLEGQSEATIEYKNYIKKSDLENGFLTLSFESPQTYGVADFDYLFVEVTDAVNPEEKLVWALAPQPETCGWWNVWTSVWVSGISELEATTRAAWTYPALLRVAGTEQTLYGVNSSYVNQWNVLYDGGTYYDAGYNLGAKTAYFVRPSETEKMNWLQFSLMGSQAMVNNNLVANITNTEWLQDSGEKLIGTQYENVYTEERMSSLFTSGYCTMKIRYMGLHSDTVECHIKKIGAQTLTDGVKKDTPYMEIKQTTHAVLGKAYALPEIVVNDMREGDISARASYRFYNERGEELSYTSNSISFPTVGEYTMQGCITLNSGETFTFEKMVYCYADMPKTEFNVQVDWEEVYYTGDSIPIPSVTAFNKLSTEKDFSVTPLVVLLRNGQEVARFDARRFNYYTIEKEGTYVLAYMFNNAYGVTDTLTYMFKAEKTIGFTPAYLPVSFASGVANTIADCTLVDYVKRYNHSDLYRAVYINDEQIYLAKGNQVLSGSLTFTKTWTENSVMLTYKAGYSAENLEYASSYEIPVHQTKYADDYVIIQNENGVYTRENVQVIASNEASVFEVTNDTIFTLPQRMHANGAELAFDIMAGGKFEELEVTFTDFLNPSKQIVFTAKRYGSGTLLYINGKDAGNIGISFENNNDYFHTIYECDDVNNRLVNSYGDAVSSKIAKIDSWANGMPFDGYTDGTMVVRFAIKGVSGATRFSLKRVNNQGFYTEMVGDKKQSFSDFSAPVLYIDGKYETSYSLGDVVTLYRAEAYDVLKSTSYITLTIEKPDGSMYYEGAASQSQSLLLNEYGNWIVTYTTHDGSEWFTVEERYIFNVVDDVDPIITVNGNLPGQLALNTQFTFPAADVFDNNTQDCKYYIIVSRPDGMREAVEDNTYIFTKKGLYTVSYYTTDEFMNVGQKIFYVWVE